MKRRILVVGNYIVSIVFFLCAIFVVSFSQEKGKDARWESAGKQGIGTAFDVNSKIWFTLQGGSLTEVFYPTADNANVEWLQFVVVNRKTKKVETERDDAIHQIKALRTDSLSFQQINTSKSADWTITKTYTTDIEQSSILINVEFQTTNKNLNLYAYYNPSLGNSGMGDTAQTKIGLENPKGIFVVEKPKVASVLKFSSKLAEQSNGFYQVNDGFEQLKQYGKIKKQKKMLLTVTLLKLQK
jgi:glucoamylase